MASCNPAARIERASSESGISELGDAGSARARARAYGEERYDKGRHEGADDLREHEAPAWRGKQILDHHACRAHHARPEVFVLRVCSTRQPPDRAQLEVRLTDRSRIRPKMGNQGQELDDKPAQIGQRSTTDRPQQTLDRPHIKLR